MFICVFGNGLKLFSVRACIFVFIQMLIAKIPDMDASLSEEQLDDIIGKVYKHNV